MGNWFKTTLLLGVMTALIVWIGGLFGGRQGMIAMSILAPIAAMLVQMAISRSREYHADATGASFIGQPLALANALEKLGAYSGKLPLQSNPNTAHMFIVNPLSGGNLANLFSTHPPLEERVARLRGTNTTVNQRSDGDRGLKHAENVWKDLTG